MEREPEFTVKLITDSDQFTAYYGRSEKLAYQVFTTIRVAVQRSGGLGRIQMFKDDRVVEHWIIESGATHPAYPATKSEAK